MITINRINVVLFSILMLSGISLAMADSPDNIDTPDRHSVEVNGKVKVYRVQAEGLNLGIGKDQTHAELFVTLDSDPKMVYALQIHEDGPQANQVMADTLRQAYINNIPVTLYHQIPIKQQNNLKILMVQLSR